MLTRKHSIEGKEPFVGSAEALASLDIVAATRMAMAAGDITLIIDDAGLIIDASARPEEFPGYASWIGRNWIDTVTVESRPKIMEMMAGARKQQTQHWRQVNHIIDDGEVAVKYAVFPSGIAGNSIAIGRDLRETAAIQQRLLQAQQALERDYIRMRRLEARYRLLFDFSAQAIVVASADGLRIREINPAAYGLVGAKSGSLENAKLLSLFDRGARETLIAYFGSAATSGAAAPLQVHLANGGERVSLRAVGFREQGEQLLILHFGLPDRPAAHDSNVALDVIETMPDAFVLVDEARAIVSANMAFVELVGAASVQQLLGASFEDFVGRPGIDLDLIDGQLAKHGSARNVATVTGGAARLPGEPVELSAVRTTGPDPHTGYVIRQIGRRLRDLEPMLQDQTRSVEQLTELVGRMSLKDIVRESTDLIERLCIEAALTYTSDNRASAAEILGLSRQSLYSKLHRYSLGDLSAPRD